MEIVIVVICVVVALTVAGVFYRKLKVESADVFSKDPDVKTLGWVQSGSSVVPILTPLTADLYAYKLFRVGRGCLTGYARTSFSYSLLGENYYDKNGDQYPLWDTETSEINSCGFYSYDSMKSLYDDPSNDGDLVWTASLTHSRKVAELRMAMQLAMYARVTDTPLDDLPRIDTSKSPSFNGLICCAKVRLWGNVVICERGYKSTHFEFVELYAQFEEEERQQLAEYIGWPDEIKPLPTEG